jgi:undecaprenyl-diphosphatase
MNWFEALVLGLVQGLTEFLPVSSSGHLEIADALFKVKPSESFYFTIVVHGATVLSTIVVFWQEIMKLIRGSLQFKMNEETKYLFKIVVSMIPVLFVGLFFKDFVENMFSGNLVATGIEFLITALLLAAAHFIKPKNREISYFDSFIIGIAQAIAVIPAISRSGATIATGLMLGNKKEEVARFSFLMVILPIIGANALEIVKGGDATGGININVLAIGFVTAFVSGYFACRWMIELVKRSKLIWFAAYCALAGVLSILIGW